MKISRNQELFQNIERGNYLDYEYFLKHSNDKPTFANNRRRALLKLVSQVINNELSAQQRTCVVLVKVKGYSQKDTAKELGVNPSTVCRHLQAAERKFNLAYKHFKTIENSILTAD